ncbi:MAG: P-loop NTPase [Candidatus Korarchaeota archaeon]|nr:P-loop NTPase [Candidatus Korarchaeota archaeon]
MAARKNLARSRLVVPVVSPKGGVGKTLVSSMLALLLRDRGLRTGLLDLDVTNPTVHVVLGIDPSETVPEEEKGIIPPVIHGIQVMTPAFYSWDNPLVLRGDAVASAIREMLAITRWGELDVLLIDMPPGLSDELLEAMLLAGSPLPLLVSTQSILSLRSTERIAAMLRDAGTAPLGLVENMAMYRRSPYEDRYRELGVRLLAVLPFEPGVEEAMGRPEVLLHTGVAEELRRHVAPLLEHHARGRGC